MATQQFRQQDSQPIPEPVASDLQALLADNMAIESAQQQADADQAALADAQSTAAASAQALQQAQAKRVADYATLQADLAALFGQANQARPQTPRR